MNMFVRLFCLAAAAGTVAAVAQDNVIRTESRVVLVDAVVTDKKGKYVRDLKQKDFRVWEDNKEQTITSFTFEADAASLPRMTGSITWFCFSITRHPLRRTSFMRARRL